MDHPYKEFEGTPLWAAIDGAISKLEQNSDVALTTAREHVIGYIAKTVSPGALCSLSPNEYTGLLNVVNEACGGANPIEDWECEALTGLTKVQLLALHEKLRAGLF